MNYRNLLLSIVVLSFLLSCSKDKTTDPTPNTCTEVTIGSQVWMCKNLDVDHYRNGDSIPEVKDSVEWAKLTTGAWCYYNNDPAMGAIYGKLYNVYAVIDPRGLAPVGWHIPSDAEWTEFEYIVDNSDNLGGWMKETGTVHWKAPNIGATNESGFTGLPGGWRNSNGSFELIGIYGNWISNTEDFGVQNRFYGFWLGNELKNRVRVSYERLYGLSVRCVRD